MSNKCPLKKQHSGDHRYHGNSSSVPSNNWNGSAGQLPPPPPPAKSRTRRNSINHGSLPTNSIEKLQSTDSLDVLSQATPLRQRQHSRSSSNSSDGPASPPVPFTTSPGENWTRFKEEDVPENYDPNYEPNFDEGRPLVENCLEEEESDDGGLCEPVQVSRDDEESSESDDIWTFSASQREYYKQQFLSIQGDPSALVSGPAAKAFFEKSKLPTVELSRIWQLSDVDKDGALNIDEFCVAMHLVVLRRNQIDLPTALPECLKSCATNISGGSNISIDAECLANPSASLTTNHSNLLSVRQAAKVNLAKGLVSPGKMWTQFNSPTADLLINVMSPPELNRSAGTHPANFDFSASSIEQDPKILHPIALRVTPEGSGRLYSSNESLTFQQQQQNGIRPEVVQQQQPPLQPPPRPVRQRVHGHTRSSSLDLNQLGRPYANLPPPLPPPSNGIGPAAPGHPRSGAFTIYRKPDCIGQPVLSDNMRAKFGFPPDIADPEDIHDPDGLYITIQSLRERGQLLEHMNGRLMAELANVIESNRQLTEQLSKLGRVSEM